MMKMNELLSMKSGEALEVGTVLKIGDADVMAFKVLDMLYNEMEGFTHEDIEEVITMAQWWNVLLALQPIPHQDA